MDYNYIDLGLPSGNLWADRNVGAKSPEDIGKHYDYWDAFVMVDHKEKDFREMIDNCVKTEEEINGVKGYRFTGPNGNSIFLPISEIGTYCFRCDDRCTRMGIDLMNNKVYDGHGEHLLIRFIEKKEKVEEKNYSVYLEIHIKDAEGLKKALTGKIARGEEEHIDYHLEHYKSIGVDTDTLDGLLQVIFGGKNAGLETTSDGTLVSHFDAAYGWENIMMEAFEEMAPFLEEGSKLQIYHYGGYDLQVVKNGKAIVEIKL